MPRIRTIKPDFFSSQSNGRLSRDARLVFIGLISMADDEGRLRAHLRGLAGCILPYDRDAIKVLTRSLEELISEQKIVLFVHQDGIFAHVCAWSDHQRVNHAAKSHLPSPEEDGITRLVSLEDIRKASEGLSRTGGGIKDRGSRIEDRGSRKEPAAKAASSVKKISKPKPEPDDDADERQLSAHETCFMHLECARLQRLDQDIAAVWSHGVKPAAVNSMISKALAICAFKPQFAPDGTEVTPHMQLVTLYEEFLQGQFAADEGWPVRKFLSENVLRRAKADSDKAAAAPTPLEEQLAKMQQH